MLSSKLMKKMEWKDNKIYGQWQQHYLRTNWNFKFLLPTPNLFIHSGNENLHSIF
jgi:hypothetical protein